MSVPSYAGIFYEGLQHKYVLDGIRGIRDVLGPESIDLNIISAKYGLLDQLDLVEPYDVSFNNMKNDEIIQTARDLKIHEDLQAKVPEYNIVFYLLGLNYLKTLELPFYYDACTQHVFLISPAYQSMVTEFTHDRKKGQQDHRENYFVFDAGSELGLALGVQNIALKGYVFKRLGERMQEEGEYGARDIRRNLIAHPQKYFQEFINSLVTENKKQKEEDQSKQITLL